MCASDARGTIPPPRDRVRQVGSPWPGPRNSGAVRARLSQKKPVKIAPIKHPSSGKTPPIQPPKNNSWSDQPARACYVIQPSSWWRKVRQRGFAIRPPAHLGGRICFGGDFCINTTAGLVFFSNFCLVRIFSIQYIGLSSLIRYVSEAP